MVEPLWPDVRGGHPSQAGQAIRQHTHWRWHLDEFYVKINGEMRYLWRAVGREGEVLKSYVTKTRDKAAALTFIKKALKRNGSPKAMITDDLCSYKAAMNEIGNADKQEVGRWANNRAENSHQPNQKRHLISRTDYKARRSAALAERRTLIASAATGQGGGAPGGDKLSLD